VTVPISNCAEKEWCPAAVDDSDAQSNAAAADAILDDDCMISALRLSSRLRPVAESLIEAESRGNERRAAHAASLTRSAIEHVLADPRR
jgi:hypothetical protein